MMLLLQNILRTRKLCLFCVYALAKKGYTADIGTPTNNSVDGEENRKSTQNIISLENFAKKLVSRQNIRGKTRPTIVSSCQDEKSTQKLDELLDQERYKDAKTFVIQCLLGNTKPSARSLTSLIAVLSSHGDLEGIEHVQSLIKYAYPNEWSFHIGYKHYMAEAMYKSGKVSESIQLFQKLFYEHPHKRQKISNLMNFLAIHLLKGDMEDEIGTLVKVVQEFTDQNFHHPFVNVWKCLFLAEKHRYQIIAWEMLQGKVQVKPFLRGKVKGILLVSIEKDDIEIVHRLVEVVLYLEMKEVYPMVFTALLEFYCARNDVKNALRTFYHAQKIDVVLDAAVCYRFICFVGSHKMKVPQKLLMMKYSMPQQAPVAAPVKPELKYKF